MTSGIKRTTEEIKEIVEGLGYELLDYYSDGTLRVVIKDQKGFKYDYNLSCLKTNSNLRAIDNNNPYSLENISIWLNLKNKDFELYGENIYSGNKIKMKFLCLDKNCGEVFLKKWNAIASGEGCPYCDGKSVGSKNNLLYVNPEYLAEWNYNKNKILPDQITFGSNINVWWICSVCKHEWEASPKTRKKQGCPGCASKTVTKNNGLSFNYPELIKEWDFIKNKEIRPDDLTYGSKVIVWWICSTCGFEWKTTPNKRTYRKDGCPNCSSSKGEKKIFNFLLSKNVLCYKEWTFPNCRNVLELPFDFYLPDYNLLIEYDGILHYEDKFDNPEEFKLTKKRDKIKTKYCKDNNINLLRIPYWEFDNIENILEKTLSELR